MDSAESTSWYGRHSTASLQRILPRLRARFSQVPDPDWTAFTLRMEEHFGRLFSILYRLYGRQYDFFYHLESILATAVSRWVERPDMRSIRPETWARG